MSRRWWPLGAVFWLAACSNGTPVGDPAQYDVTERGVVKSQATIDPAWRVQVRAASPDWVALQLGDRTPLYVAKSAALDASLHHFGRSDLEFPTGATYVGVELAGLDWHAGDSLQLVSPNLGLAIHGLEAHFDAPGEGATTISGQTINWANAGAALVSRAKGDTTFVAEMAVHSMAPASGSYYQSLARAGIAPDFSVSDRSSSTLAAQLAPVAQDRSLVLRWRGSAFAALAAEAGPNTRPAPAPALSIKTLPESLAANNHLFRSMYMYLPSLVDVGPVRGDRDFEQPLAYGNPFSTANSKWTEFVTLVYPMPVAIPNVGATHALVVQAVPVTELQNGALAPAISPVRNVTINGRSLAEPQSGVGNSPTVNWDAPALGAATGYSVTVQAIVAHGRGFKLEPVGTFLTRATSLVLPALATANASSYVLTVTAIAARDRDLVAKPFQAALPFASADYVTAQVTP